MALLPNIPFPAIFNPPERRARRPSGFSRDWKRTRDQHFLLEERSMATRRTVLLLGLMLFFGLMQDGILPAHGAEIEKGKKLYEEKKCGLCHVVSGKGGLFGFVLFVVGGLCV